jgi:hypothetical protein
MDSSKSIDAAGAFALECQVPVDLFEVLEPGSLLVARVEQSKSRNHDDMVDATLGLVALHFASSSEERRSTNTQVTHPKHYNQVPGIECIDVVRWFNFNRGNAMKYLWRAGEKEPAKEIQDLEKAMFYIRDEIERLQKVNREASK